MDDYDWRDKVFCMLSPDCMRRHLARRALAMFGQAGLRPIRWRLTPVTPAQLDLMSELQGVGASEAYRYRALDALFAMDPVLLLILADERGRPAARLYAEVRQLKGNADPSLAAAGTIRRELGAINIVLSLLHTSDTPERSAIECALLADGAPPALFDDYGLAHLLDVYEATQPAERRSCADVLAAVRGRVLTRLWADLSPDGRQLAAGLAVGGRLAEPSAGSLLAGHLDGKAELDPALVDVLRAPFDGSLPRPDMPRVRRVLAAHGLELDAWEYVVLITSTFFPAAG